MNFDRALNESNSFMDILHMMIPSKIHGELKEVKVHKYSENPELKKIIDEFLKKNKSKIQIKACYHNAAITMKASPDIEYVEGYAGLDLIGERLIPIEHAWNVYKGTFHFDLTSEVVHGEKGLGAKAYVEIERISDPELALKAANDVKRSVARKLSKKR